MANSLALGAPSPPLNINDRFGHIKHDASSSTGSPMNATEVASRPLSARQRDCLRLVWERQATSKEIAVELGISKRTVDGYIAEAVEALGARDRRDAAAIAFADAPRIVSRGDPIRVADPIPDQPTVRPSMKASWPWRSGRSPNAMTLAQTLGWIVIIAIGSLCVLALAVSVGNGLAPITAPVLHAFDRLTR